MKKHKKLKKMSTMLTSLVFSILFAATSFAGEWIQDVRKQESPSSNISNWWYKNDDGTYASGWVIIEGDFYYFNNEGWLLTSTITPDGYTVNVNGAMIQGLAVDRPWVNVSEAEAIGKEIQKQKGWSQNPIRIETNSATYGNESWVVQVKKVSNGYDLTLKTRLSGTSATGTQAICSLTGISNLYDIIYDSFEGNNSNGINYDTPVTIGNHTYLAINNGSSMVFQIR